MSGGPPSTRRPRWFGGRTARPDGIGVPVDLVGVRRDVAAAVRPGEALRVSVNPDGATVCTTADGRVVGALAAFTGLSGVIAHLYAGGAYVALVEEVTPTSCRVSLVEARG